MKRFITNKVNTLPSAQSCPDERILDLSRVRWPRWIVILAACMTLNDLQAASFTWTNTADQATGYWTNNALWNPPSGHPGSNPSDAAYLTNSASGAYTNILDTTPANSLSALALSNSTGQAWLIVTNATLTSAALSVNNGAHLQIDNGGILNGVSTLSWLGANATLHLNQGGQLITASAISLNNATITSADTGGIWKFSNQNLTYTGGTMTGGTLTNISSFNAYGSLVLSNANLYSTAHSYVGYYGGNNTMTLLTNAFWNSGTANLTIGYGVSAPYATNNALIVNGGIVTNSGSGTVLSIGDRYGNNRLVISNGGRVYMPLFRIGNDVTANNNLLLVTGTNSLFRAVGVNGGNNYIGLGGKGNQLIVSDGATAELGSFQSYLQIGYDAASSNNQVIITGPGSTFKAAYGFYVGSGGSSNSLIISDGGKLQFTTGNGFVVLGGNAGLSNNLLKIDGGSQPAADTSLSATALYVNGSYGTLIATNATLTTSDQVLFGNNSKFNTGAILANATWTMANTKNFIVGTNTLAAGNVFTINGGTITNAGATQVGSGGAVENRLSVANRGQLFASSLTVGSTGGTNNGALVTSGGLIEANTLVADSATGNSISNVGGIYQFTTATPTITPNGAGRISVTDGTVSFRGIANAPVTPVANLTYAGENTLRLNTASNATGLATYTFDTGLGADNYANLELAGDGSRWRSDSLRIGSGGSLTGSGTVAANTTNAGVIAPGFSPGLITFTSNLVLESSSVLQMEIGGPNPADYDRLIVNGSLSLTGALYVTTLNGYAAPTGTVFTLIDGAVPSTGQFTGLTNGAFVDAGSSFFHIEYNYNVNDVVLIATIPEPGALSMMTLAAVAFLWRRRR